MFPFNIKTRKFTIFKEELTDFIDGFVFLMVNDFDVFEAISLKTFRICT